MSREKSAEYCGNLTSALPGAAHYNFREAWNPKGIVFKKGRGSRLTDIDDNEYLDFYSNFGSNILGHGNEQYISKVFQAISSVSSNSLSHLSLDVSEQICSLVPSAELVRFPVTGTEAVQAAIRLARAYTGKQKFLRFTGNYHGHADNTLGGKPAEGEVPYPVDFQGDARASKGLADGIRETQSFLIPWNDIDLLRDVVNRFGPEIACIITEPLAVNAGGIMPLPGYLEGMREICDKHNIVLIFDEIITGFRVGLSGAQGLFKVMPDLTTLGKAMGGGMMPIAAIAGQRDIMSLLERQEVVQAGTFNGYHAGLAACHATLGILQGSEGIGKVAANGKKLMHIFKEAAARYDIPLKIQSHPSCFYLHITDQEICSTEQWNSDIKARDTRLQNILIENGIIIAPTSRCYPSVSLTDEDLALFEKRVDRSFYQLKPDLRL